MYPRVLEPPKSSFFLLGARGTGKSTWLESHFRDARKIDLLDQATFHRYLSDVAAFGRELEAQPPHSWVVIDEIQKLPELLDQVHRMIERRRLKFALTGSSARKLKRSGINLLAGRALHRRMHTLLPEEMGTDFDLSRALRSGTLPIVVSSETPDETLESYIQLYLREEIQAEATVRNLGGFARFLPISALFHGQVLNVSSLSRDAGVARTTVNGYLEVLQDTLVATLLPAYEGALRVRERKHPKFYWFDPGVARSLKRIRGEIQPEEAGPLFEGLVLGILRAESDYRDLFDGIHYWAPAEAKLTEVDFLLTRGREKVAIEAKYATRIREEHFKGLRAIEELPHLKRRFLVYTGESRQKTSDGIEIVPIAELSALLSGL